MVIAAALLLASTQTLVGDWAFVDAHRDASKPVELCETDFGARYERDGTFIGYEEEGRWSAAGEELTEIVEREMVEGGDLVAVKPTRRVFRLRWLSPDHVNIEKDGEMSGMIRCPPAR